MSGYESNSLSPAQGAQDRPAVAAGQPGSGPLRALIAAVSGYAMDGFDLLILGFMMSVVSADLGLSATEGGSLVTATLIGGIFGGVGFGILSDYCGRVRVLTYTILVFAIFTGLCAFATGYWDLLVYRFLAGLGLGGEFGIGMALAIEAWPAEKRGRVSSYVGMGWQLGVLLAAVLTPLLLPHIGWRGMFVVGVVPALGSFVIRKVIGESELFLESTRKKREFPIKTLFRDARTTKRSIGVMILCSVQNFGYYGLIVWMPAYLSKMFGYSLAKSAVWTGASIIGMLVGIWIFGQLADRIGRRPTFIGYQIGALAMVFVYSQLSTPEALLIGGIVMGVFVNGMMGGYGALMAELYPTHARGTAQNVLWSIGRGVGGLSPLAIGVIAAHYSFEIAIAALAGIYVIDILATIFLIPELKGVELE
ncbi:MFS transporter [Pandoraea nosoerga]|uniref:MFS transporter n=1 Tax=Pandoraea nosoerga TaxID=2508296 RepID=A0A5E4RC65_9BURK|nr:MULTISPECIES: MFS transporter [Pandoraea]MBN4666723.1 MFS transporter [Pandoraea nosoerga]MBN4676871.1 MFS transporter [Pandoraea nosoerga]MBN4681522.1 MFS transporter [Pandoraea nosoerga]MBN4745990.1 MFS transporter [Pandoraea nosoerga]VVD60755.1 MFS transporter [Pandoraea nosoerga]